MSKNNNPDLLLLNNNMFLDVPNSKESNSLLRKDKEIDKSLSIKDRHDSISNQSMSRLNNSKNGLINNKGAETLLNKLILKKSEKSKSIEESEKNSKNNSLKGSVILQKHSSNQVIELKNMDGNPDFTKKLKKSFSKSYVEDPEDDDDKLDETNRQDVRKLVKKEKICDSDTEDEGTDNEKEVRFVILPDNSFKKKWDLLIAIILIYTAIVLPFRVSFIDKDSDFYIGLDYFFDSIFALDVVFNFFSAYIDNEDNIIKNRHKITINYLKTWFVIDVLSILPITTFINTDSSKNKANYSNLLRIARLPKLYRLVKLSKLFRMVKVVKKGNVNKITKYFLEKLKVNANIERLIYFIFGFLILNHLSACVWYLIAKLQDFEPDCWVTRLGYIDATPTEIYIISFYWTLTTVTTVGYGDINAGTTLERMFNLFIMSFGVLMYSFAIGSLSSIVSTLDAKTAEMNQKLQILSSIKSEFKLDQDIYDKVRKVIKYDLSRNQKDKMNFLQELPNKLRIELSKIMHDKLIEKLYFFRDQPSDFIAYVAPLLKPVKFTQNDYLYKISDMIDEMYFVAKGTISFSLSKEYLEKEIKEVKKNNNFGEIEMCLNEKLTYNIKVKSRNCELFVLKKNDFLRLSVNFKEFIEKFLQKSLMLYLRFNDERKRLMREMEESKLIVGSGNDSSRKKYVEKNSLEEIPEDEDDGGNASEEHDIYDNQSSKNSKNSDDKNVEVFSNDEDEKKSNKDNDSQSNKSNSNNDNSNSNSNNDSKDIKNEDSAKPSVFNFMNPYEDNNYKKKNSLLDSYKKESNHNVIPSSGKLQSKDLQINIPNPNNGNKLNQSIKESSNKEVKNQINNFLIPKEKNKTKSGKTNSANNSSLDSSFNQSSMNEANKNPNEPNKTKSKKKNYTEKEINLQNLKTQKSALSNLSHLEKNKSGEYDSDKMSNFIKNLPANPEIEALSANDVNYMNAELSEQQLEKKRNIINQTFNDKVEKIISFLEEHKIEFSNKDMDNNPLEMLKKLRDIQDTNQRNEIIDKIEVLIAELFKNDMNNNEGNNNNNQ